MTTPSKPRRKFKEKIPLEKDSEVLEQYGRPSRDLTLVQETSYSRAIGRFLMSFSSLETALDHMIISAVSDRADERGYRIIKYLEFRDKINLSKDEYKRRISFISLKKTKDALQEKLDVVIRKLEEISEFRNKVAHANWESLEESGFVRTRIKEDKTGEGIRFERVKMTPVIIEKFTRQSKALANSIDRLGEEVLMRMFD